MVVLDEKLSVTRKQSEGSTSPQEVKKQIIIATQLLDQWIDYNNNMEEEWQNKYDLLLEAG